MPFDNQPDTTEGPVGLKKKADVGKAPAREHVSIPAPNFQIAVFHVIGTRPYVQHKFSEKARKAMMDAMSTPKKQRAKSKGDRPPRNFDEDYRGAMHTATDSWHGIPASAFRNAMISACRLVNFKMTHAKQCIFVVEDGEDEDGWGLVRIVKGKPVKHTGYVRYNGTVDIAVRPMWKQWEAKVQIEYDADTFTMQDVANLLARAGRQVGIGEGRPDSKDSAGCGWGQFRLASNA